MHNIEVDKARAFIYNLLALTFVEEHVKTNSKVIEENLNILAQNSFDADVTLAVNSILNFIQKEGVEKFYIEYQELFLIPFGEQISLSTSWYYDEREASVMLVKIRDIIAKTKIRRDEKSFSAPEDHFGFIFAFASYLINEEINSSSKDNLQKELFETLINPFCDQLFYKLIGANKEIYSNIGIILNNFMNLERNYLNVNKPKGV